MSTTVSISALVG